MLPAFATPLPAPAHRPRVSIVITNHNYERFVPSALASALGQRGADVEVVVVDDGSTDGSRDILARQPGDFRLVLQENRGQADAMNAGFEAAAGDVVIFLDGDDELAPGTAAAVAQAFARHPGVVRVVFRLAVVDGEGRPTGAVVPARHMPLPRGDVRAAVLAHADDLPWPPTSGNAFAAAALRRLLPLPGPAQRTGADTWLHALTPLLGPVAALDGIGGSYRLHGRNAHMRERLDVCRSQAIVRRAALVYPELDRMARDLGYGGARPRSVTIAAHRLVSLRLTPGDHPLGADTRRGALGAGLRAAAARSDVGVARRLAYAAWFLAVAAVPPALVRPLAEAAFQPVRGRRRPRP